MKGQVRPSARCRAVLLELSLYLDGELPAARERSDDLGLATLENEGAVGGLALTHEMGAGPDARPPAHRQQPVHLFGGQPFEQPDTAADSR